MTEIKFACPSCGQAIQGNPECANQNVPCPSCATLIRVPADAEFTESPELAPDANPFQSPEAKVSYAEAGESQQQQETIAASPSNLARSKPVSAIREQLEASSPISRPAELHCTCPVCQSELRISVTAGAHTKPNPVGDRLPESSAFGTKPQPSEQHLSLAEREKKIAAAREAHPVLHPTTKPRLDRILSDEAAKLEFIPPQMPNSAEEYQPEIDPDQILRSHNSE